MNSEQELKDLWNMQRTSAPDIREINAAITELQKKNRKRLLMVNILLPLTSAIILAIWYFFQPQMLTTKIGIILVILAMATFTAVANRTFPFLNKVNPDTNIKDYLLQLQAYKVRQAFLQKTMMNIYFLFLTTGMCLYMIEATKEWKYPWLAYITSLGWVLFNYLYTKPRREKDYRKEINRIIDSLKKFDGQSN